jgi:hypothetical protein
VVEKRTFKWLSVRTVDKEVRAACHTHERAPCSGSSAQLGASSFFDAVSGRNHKETWAGCIVSLTTLTRSSLKASRSVSSLSLAEKASRVFLASYFLR